MGDLEFWEEDFEEKLREISAMTERLPKLTGDEKRNIIVACDKKLNQLKTTTRRTYAMELRQLDRSSRSLHQSKLDGYDAQIEKIENELKWARKETDDRTALLGDRSGRDTNDVPQMSREDLLTNATKTQDKTEEALQRTLVSINEANQVGDEILVRMAEQREQITRIDEGLTNIRTELDLATDIMKSFLKRIMTDKLLVIFIIVIVLAFIGLVIYASVR